MINFLSDYLICTSTRDGYRYTLKYEDGLLKDEEKKKVSSDTPTGTEVVFRPSDKYLKEIDKLKCKNVMEMIEAKAECCPGIVTVFKGIKKNGEEIKEKFVGLKPVELVRKYNQTTSRIWEFVKDENDLKINLAFGYDAKMIEGDNILGYCNYIKNVEGGTHVNGLVSGINEFFKKYMDKYLSEKEKKDLQIRKEDIKLGLCGAVIVLMTNAEFRGQYKQELTNSELEDTISKWIKTELSKLPDKELQEIAVIIKNNAKARISSLKERQKVKKVGNRLSNDYIDNYIDTPIRYDGDYKEMYWCEGLSAGEQLASARYEFQSIFKLRGKIDNIIDYNMNKIATIDMVERMSRCMGIAPGRRGILNHDAYKILTDADVDGYYIRASIVATCAKAFPQVIDEGKLFVVIPPLYSYKEDGKTKFVESSRKLMQNVQERFSKKNELYFKDRKLSTQAVQEFLVRNERYIEFVKNLANNNAINPLLMEVICANIRELGIDIKSVDKWDKIIKKKYSKQFKAIVKDGVIIIRGIKNAQYNIARLEDELISCKRMKKVLSVMDSNMNDVYGYGINGEDGLSLYETMVEFDKYKPNELKRFKGLGQMTPEDLDDTCMNLNNQICKKITWGDVDEAKRALMMMHSGKKKHLEERRVFMANYVPDILDIDT